MCIRDRACGELEAIIKNPGETGSGSTQAKDCSYGGKRIDSVSYTHLRAHETVLDLVCRLLLEKKKKYR